jgi:hypothetical protein
LANLSGHIINIDNIHIEKMTQPKNIHSKNILIGMIVASTSASIFILGIWAYDQNNLVDLKNELRCTIDSMSEPDKSEIAAINMEIMLHPEYRELSRRQLCILNSKQ